MPWWRRIPHEDPEAAAYRREVVRAVSAADRATARLEEATVRADALTDSLREKVCGPPAWTQMFPWAGEDGDGREDGR